MCEGDPNLLGVTVADSQLSISATHVQLIHKVVEVVSRGVPSLKSSVVFRLQLIH